MKAPTYHARGALEGEDLDEIEHEHGEEGDVGSRVQFGLLVDLVVDEIALVGRDVLEVLLIAQRVCLVIEVVSLAGFLVWGDIAARGV